MMAIIYMSAIFKGTFAHHQILTRVLLDSGKSWNRYGEYEKGDFRGQAENGQRIMLCIRLTMIKYISVISTLNLKIPHIQSAKCTMSGLQIQIMKQPGILLSL